jgi:5-hydroxyisourate hydrolase-like protein (transthyretin family)
MNRMSRRSLLRLSVFAIGLGIALVSLAAGAQQDNARRPRKFKVPPASARIEVTVLRDVNGKPVENAAVIFHPMEGERDKGVLELKTNEDGKTVIDVLPIGDTVRLQVIAHGFQTYGQDFKVDKAEMAFTIRLKRPGGQYSIYKNQGDAGSSSTNAAPSTPPANAKPAGPASQPNPSPSQPK